MAFLIEFGLQPSEYRGLSRLALDEYRDTYADIQKQRRKKK